MPFSWNTIHNGLLRSASTLTFGRDFAEMLDQHPGLARFTDVTALLDHLHRGTASRDEKNQLLATLTTAAQSMSAARDIAVTVLLLALWPGLDAVFHRLSRRVEAPDELPSQILDRAVEQMRRLDLRSVRWIAATILMNIERDVARADVRVQRRQRLAVELDVDLVADEGPEPSSMPNLLLRDAVRHAGEDGRIVVSVAVDGFSRSRSRPRSASRKPRPESATGGPPTACGAPFPTACPDRSRSMAFPLQAPMRRTTKKGQEV